MRSTELASLAGVSVRTLRHYHQVGLLPEPERSANGYRRYTASHLATVLRIARFTELGIPLAEVARVLDDEAASAALLGELDAQAAHEIERLVRRRARIAELDGASPDTPTALIPLAPALFGRSPSSALRFEREQMVLIEHLSEDRSLPWLAAAAAALAVSAEYPVLVERLANLQDTAPASDLDALGGALAEVLREATALQPVSPLSSAATELVAAHQAANLNDAQRAVIARVIQRLDGSTEPRAEAPSA